MERGEQPLRRKPWQLALAVVTAAVALVPAALLLIKSETGTLRAYTPIRSFLHVHGLAVDPTDPQTLYVATHQGLVKGVLPGPDANAETIDPQSLHWFQVGGDRSDLMGFTAHPRERILYSSGHPPEGGNWGLRISTDGGLNWEVLALKDEIDFHALAVSPLDPTIMYGWDSWTMGLFRSVDGGRSWERPRASGLPQRVFSLVADPVELQGLWAATDRGLYHSRDGGETWEPVTGLAETAVAALAFHPAASGTLYAYVADQGLLRGSQGGRTWTRIDRNLPQEITITYLAFDPLRPEILYAASDSATLYRSDDGGESFIQIQPGY